MLARRVLVGCGVLLFLAAVSSAEDAPPVSYSKQILPIFQTHCQGCHQPAKDLGGYVMTAFDKLLQGGESESAAIVPGDPDGSYLLDQITPEDGQAEMPKGKKPLAESEIDLIRRWIEQGAKDDSPASGPRYSMENLPKYSRAPVINSLDFSPDGKLLAIAGFHEVLLVNAENWKLAARLVGLSERIESVRFSPDGKRLAVAGGNPSRMGEIQVWDVQKRELTLSASFTGDTLYGGKWSPDGKMIAFGCADNTLRAIDSTTGKQVLFQGAHNDWVRDTVFSNDNKHLVSVGRDMSAKLTEVETERFVDNITSITPGGLSGGINSVARHPQRDEIVIGGADGAPKVYRMIRQTKRVIGDDANRIRVMPAIEGRIFSVDVSADGKRIVAAGGLNGKGEVRVYGYEFDTSLPADIKKINTKVVTQRNADEKKRLAAYHVKDVQQISQLKLDASVYSTAFHPDGKHFAVAGADGAVRIVETETGKIAQTFSPAPVEDAVAGMAQREAFVEAFQSVDDYETEETLPAGAKLAELLVSPQTVELSSPFAYNQLLVTAKLASGEEIDATRIASIQLENGELATLSKTGLVRPLKDGETSLTIELQGQKHSVPVKISRVSSSHDFQVDFIRDVNPALSRLGCNAGTCHGANKGKNGFKLSLRGYDAIFDIRALTDDLASRRVSVASPRDSLMLLKPTGAAPHVGGVLLNQGEAYYDLVHRWVADGAQLDLKAPRVAQLELQPTAPVVQTIGARQQIRVIAVYTDGARRDVTREAFLESGDNEIATADRNGVMTSLRRGEAPVLARYEGAYAAATLTVMGDRSGFQWEQPPTFNRIDELTAAKWRRMKILPSGLCGDEEYLRRVHLDLTGLPPTAEQVRQFLADKRPTQQKRDAVVEALIGNKDFVDYWTNKWSDLLQVNRKFLGAEGAASLRAWIRNEVEQNTPYDQFARKVLTASGSNKENPAAAYYKVLRTPEDIMENTTHLFLGVRFNCNKCHDHPFERWTQDQYYETAAYFARVGLKADPQSGKRRIGGTAVEGAKPFYEIVFDKPDGEVTHERTKQVAAPKFPFDCQHEAEEKASRREQLASWITAADNPYFARSYVNRLWGYMLGVGLIEPIDDIRAGNPPTNPELLDYLAQEFIDSGFDARHVMRLICKSRTYQLSVKSHRWNEDDHLNYSHAQARRLPAEVLFDSIHFSLGATPKIPGVPAGTRAAQLPDSGVKLPSGFLANLGRPVRESACECERGSGLQLGPVMALISGPIVGNAIADGGNSLAKMVNEQKDDAKVIDELFLKILNRHAEKSEIDHALGFLRDLPKEHDKLNAQLQVVEKELAPSIAKAEAARQKRIGEAKNALVAYEKEVAPREEKLQKEWQAKLDKAQAEFDSYQKQLPAKQAEWEKSAGEPTVWKPIDPAALSSTSPAKLAKEKDLSIFVSGGNGKGTYKISAAPGLANITGVKLELLADKRLPKNGPGRAPNNGNFVLSEFRVEWASKADPKKKEKAVLQNAEADFSQNGYAVATAIDGKVAPTNNGWAGSPKLGANRTAVFETKANLGPEADGTLTFFMDQQFQDGNHSIGRFRISVTNSPRPIRLKGGIPENIAKVLKVAVDKRTAKQKQELSKYYQGVDGEYQKRQKVLAESKKPRVVDPKLKGLRDKVAEVSKPLPIEPRLARLRQDVKTSQQQLANQRLTVVQDLAWALINTPAFLFNR